MRAVIPFTFDQLARLIGAPEGAELIRVAESDPHDVAAVVLVFNVPGDRDRVAYPLAPGRGYLDQIMEYAPESVE